MEAVGHGHKCGEGRVLCDSIHSDVCITRSDTDRSERGDINHPRDIDGHVVVRDFGI